MREHNIASQEASSSARREIPVIPLVAGVLVVDGYGARITVRRERLLIDDGVADDRRRAEVERTDGLERLVVLAPDGYVTFEAVRWIRGIGAAIVHIDRDGFVVSQSTPLELQLGAPLRRALALAPYDERGLAIARSLIGEKIAGQRRLLRRLGVKRTSENTNEAAGAKSIDELRIVEARAAAEYWAAWSSVSVRFARADLARVPPSWTRATTRASVLTGTPRAASHPLNSILNFCYSVACAEVRIALVAHGLDVSLGVMHSDAPHRDSLVLDAIEPLRPKVDEFVLDLLATRTWRYADFEERRNGVCRLRESLTHELARTHPQWRVLAMPVAARIAAALRTADRGSSEAPRFLGASRRLGQKTRAIPAYRSPAWRTPRPEQETLLRACDSCGAPVPRRRRRYCDACLDEVRAQHTDRRIKVAHSQLASARAAGEDPRTTPEAQRKRARGISEAARRRRAITPDESLNWDDIAPLLDVLTLEKMRLATGLSFSFCSRIRAGKVVPNRAHWAALAALLAQNDRQS
jgi:CRISPR-associated endonuclease Cas1